VRPATAFALAFSSLIAPEVLASDSPLPVFVDITREAGIRFEHVSGSPEKNYIFEAKGGGVCLLDYDQDGLLDIFFVNGSTLDDVQEGVNHPHVFYRANDDGTYSDVTEGVGLVGAGWGMGCTVGDYDNDGLPDIYVLGVNRNTLYRNTPEGLFADVTKEAGLEGGRWSTSAAFLDHDLDGDLDLYVANNIEVDIYRSPLSFQGPNCNYRGTRVMCGPRGLPGARDAFYRNDGDGTFTDVTQAAGLLEPEPYYGLGVAVGDFDNDGWPDIYVANDSTPSYLYRNQKDGTFEDVALLSGVAVSDDGMEQAGMGVDFGDYDNDGWLDIVKSNFAFEYSNLYRNDEGESFTDQSTRAAGTGPPSRPLVSWGTKFLDYDNDGWKDIVVANGHVYPHLIPTPVEGERYHQPRLLLRNLGDGHFADVTAESGPGMSETLSSRGLATGDLDNDGDVDVIIVNIDGVPSVLRNDGGNARSWLTVALRGTTSNRMGQGARITARTEALEQICDATTAGSVFSASDPRVHFGLADATRVDLEIRWPSGTVQTLKNVAANQILEVVEPRVAVSRDSPGPAVDVTPIPPSPLWPNATEEGALSLACAPTSSALGEHFAREDLPYRTDLLRDDGGRVCHVLYRPTVPGFRASPDDEPLKEILFDSDGLLYLATARENRGDVLGAMTEVLSRIPRRLDVGVFTHRLHEESAYERATKLSFGDTPHGVRLLDRGVERSFWWVQDYMKAGTSDGRETILVPYRIFEGNPKYGELYDPLLEQRSGQKRVTRSRLAWEGGDLQFTRDPRDESKLVLYYGKFVKPYWGESLSQGEFEYVLSLEFGADRAVDLGGLAPHVDYFVLFLARERVALVSVARSGDLDVARAVLERLLARFAGREPQTLRELKEALSSPNPDPSEVARLINEARRQQGTWSFAVDGDLFERTEALVAELCPGREDCFTPSDQVRLAEANPALFEEWIHAVQHAREEQPIVTAHLDLLESQIEPIPQAIRSRTLEKIAELEGMGFRVIQMPAFRVNLRKERDWPGISYVNGLVVDKQIFLPQFGLGEIEDGIFRLVDAQLPEGYSIVPIYAQRVLIRNGGLHCLTGLVR